MQFFFLFFLSRSEYNIIFNGKNSRVSQNTEAIKKADYPVINGLFKINEENESSPDELLINLFNA